ncbi:MAG: glycosyltransferase family 2 protein [Alphaproteobacteria bacterium]|nr:glycosyltransferase family 2 protein [Alphaproteobacteria bacterium]
MDGVSFVCTVYNKAGYLPGVIDALARQVPDRPRQFIFIDDGSSDASAAVVEQATASWPDTVLVRQPNGGPTVATNAGIARARHRYLKLLGSDDVLAPFATRVLIETLERTGADAVFSQQDYYRDLRGVAFIEKPVEPRVPDDPLADVIARTVSGTRQTLYRLDAIHRVGGCDPGVFAEDFSLALRVANHGRIALLNLVTAVGPAGDGERLMVGRKHQTFHDYNLALARFIEQNPGISARLRRLALRRAAGRAAKWARREGGHRLPLRYLLLDVAARIGLPIDHARAIRATLSAFALGPAASARPLILPAVSLG